MRIAKSARTLAVLVPLIIPALLRAAPNDYVVTPIVEQGEKEIDFKWGTEKRKNMSSGTATSLGFGVGVNSYWFTELYVKWKRSPGESNAFDAVEWENLARRILQQSTPAGSRVPCCRV